jgi:integrase
VNTELYIPKTEEEIKKVEDLLLSHCGTQMRDIWRLGLVLGLRINELLQMKFSDLNGEISQIELSKTRQNSISSIHLSPTVKEIILSIKKQHPLDKFVFQSRSSRNIKNRESKPISRQAVYKAFKEVGDILNVKLSPHSMRRAAVINLLRNFDSGSDVSNYIPSSKFITEVLRSYYISPKDSE